MRDYIAGMALDFGDGLTRSEYAAMQYYGESRLQEMAQMFETILDAEVELESDAESDDDSDDDFSDGGGRGYFYDYDDGDYYEVEITADSDEINS
ncbi:MAG: hypothetical protein ACR2H1_11410 [Limisphaerales bacterium]